METNSPTRTRSPGEPAKEHITEEKQKARDKIGSAKAATSRKSQEAFDQLKEGGQRIARESGAHARKLADEQKNSLIGKLNEYRSAAEAAKTRLEGEDDPVAAERVGQLESGIGRVADYLENRDPRDLLDDLGTTTRKHPEVVLGSLFLLGLGAARFFKASARKRRAESFAEGGPVHLSGIPYGAEVSPSGRGETLADRRESATGPAHPAPPRTALR